MKHLKLFEELINEIGDASAKPYKWKWMDPRYDSYSLFTTDSGLEYQVMTSLDALNADGEILSVEYGVKFVTKKGSKSIDYKLITNRGELFRVMATVVDIIQEFIKKNPGVEYIEFEGSKNKDGDQRRNKLYMQYIKKHLKPKSIEDDGATIRVEL
tara:strand:- start:578 stop:1045 length:468 start_codon:yes stop_codon:yes gene_type:complete